MTRVLTVLTPVGLALLALVAPSSAQEPSRGTPDLFWAGEEVHIPMPAKQGRSLVEVFVGEAGPLDFLIDTGSSLTVLDTRTAKTLGLEAIDTLEVGAPGGGKVPAAVVDAPRIKVGGLSVSGAQPIVLDIAEMTGGIIEGVLGMDLFADAVLILDPEKELATISRAGLEKGGAGVIELDTSQGRWNFNIEVAGRSIVAHIDTGSPGGFTLPIELMKTLPLVPGEAQRGVVGLVGGERQMTVRTLDGIIRLGDLVYENPRVSFLDPSPGAANLGSSLMAELVLTIDQPRGLLAFRASDAAKRDLAQSRAGSAAEVAPRRLGVGFRGSPGGGFTTVSSVEPGSLGASAGFEPGDKLVSLNGRLMSDFAQRELHELIMGSGALNWEVERNGERLLLRIP